MNFSDNFCLDNLPDIPSEKILLFCLCRFSFHKIYDGLIFTYLVTALTGQLDTRTLVPVASASAM